MSNFGLLGGAAGYAVGGLPGAMIGSAIGGAYDTNQSRAESAAQAQAFSAEQYATRYQTQVKDMEAAGLNPMLAYMQAPGSAPQGVSYQPINPYERVASDYASAYNVERMGRKMESETENIDVDTVRKRAERFLIEAQTDLAGASADEKRSNINVLEHQAKKIAEEIKNIPKEGERLEALVQQLYSSNELIKSQTASELERAKQLRYLAVKTMLESDLLGFDVKAATDAGNLGRQAGQYKPVVDAILSAIRTLRR